MDVGMRRRGDLSQIRTVPKFAEDGGSGGMGSETLFYEQVNGGGRIWHAKCSISAQIRKKHSEPGTDLRLAEERGTSNAGILHYAGRGIADDQETERIDPSRSGTRKWNAGHGDQFRAARRNAAGAVDCAGRN